jgi:hypothetical protein
MLASWEAGTGVAALALSAGGLSAQAAFTSPSHPAGAAANLPRFVLQLPETAGPATQAPRPAPGHHRARVRARPPAFVLTVTGRVSWVEVSRPSGRVLAGGLWRHGRHIVVRRGPLRVVIGDASAVRIVRHGHRIRRGRPGAVRRLAVR